MAGVLKSKIGHSEGANGVVMGQKLVRLPSVETQQQTNLTAGEPLGAISLGGVSLQQFARHVLDCRKLGGQFIGYLDGHMHSSFSRSRDFALKSVYHSRFLTRNAVAASGLAAGKRNFLEPEGDLRACIREAKRRMVELSEGCSFIAYEWVAGAGDISDRQASGGHYSLAASAASPQKRSA